MTAADVRVSVIILSRNARATLEACLAALPEGLAEWWATSEVIVIDNGSTDGTSEWLSTCPLVTAGIRNDVNRGVAAGRNQGLSQARGEFAVLLDDDTRCRPSGLARLVNYLRDHETVSLVGPKLISEQGKLQWSCRRFPTAWSKVLRRVPRAEALIRSELLLDWDHNTPRPVDYVIGACQAFRRELVERIGLLDENIFYGPEDIDFCLRTWRSGMEVHYVADAVVVHDERRVTRRRPFDRIAWLHAKALLYYFSKHHCWLAAPRGAEQTASGVLVHGR